MDELPHSLASSTIYADFRDEPLHQERGNEVVGRVEECGRDVADCADYDVLFCKGFTWNEYITPRQTEVVLEDR